MLCQLSYCRSYPVCFKLNRIKDDVCPLDYGYRWMMPSFCRISGLCLFSGDGSFCGFYRLLQYCALYLAAVLLASSVSFFRGMDHRFSRPQQSLRFSLLFCNNKNILIHPADQCMCLGQLTLILRFHSLFGLVNMLVLLLQVSWSIFALQVSAGALVLFFHLNTEIVRMTHAARNPTEKPTEINHCLHVSLFFTDIMNCGSRRLLFKMANKMIARSPLPCIFAQLKNSCNKCKTIYGWTVQYRPPSLYFIHGLLCGPSTKHVWKRSFNLSLTGRRVFLPPKYSLWENYSWLSLPSWLLVRLSRKTRPKKEKKNSALVTGQVITWCSS